MIYYLQLALYDELVAMFRQLSNFKNEVIWLNIAVYETIFPPFPCKVSQFLNGHFADL